ncbi:hypothetical protein [Clostridium uliginosum]|uniref:Uncharacterized protein n=1 Tax=Clostridium uliginosum TaxID=119641 RepID=A0A1I1MQ64_9CLOT|nr:hypothetical protein [Clostridium uliginosum]SFC85328.1 hypothetical protein SAMN05421842_11124 [Clostridium uliginosum]
MPESLITTIISAISILLGATIGAICSWRINKITTLKNIEVQTKIVKENRQLEEKMNHKNLCAYANIVRLDICTAIFESIDNLRILTHNTKNQFPIYIPVNGEYSKAIVSLTGIFDLKEMSYLYQLYGIIEKINYDMKNFNYTSEDMYELIKIDCEIFLKKLYGKNFNKILEKDIKDISYKDLFNNNIIKEGYKNVLLKLEEICESPINNFV